MRLCTFNWDLASDLKCVNKAVLIEYLKAQINKNGVEHENNKYVKVDFDEIKKTLLPWVSDNTIKQYLRDLTNSGWLLAEPLDTHRRSRKLYYAFAKPYEQIHALNIIKNF